MGAGGEEKVFGHVEQGGRTGAILVPASLGEQVAVDEGTDHRVGVHAAGGADAGARQGTQI
jgi:hypothetical protein